MQVYVQKSTRTTFPPTSAAVSGGELSHPVGPVETREATLGGHRSRPSMAEHIEPAHVGEVLRRSYPGCLRSGLKLARTSSEKSCGCSHAAK